MAARALEVSLGSLVPCYRSPLMQVESFRLYRRRSGMVRSVGTDGYRFAAGRDDSGRATFAVRGVQAAFGSAKPAWLDVR